MFKAAWKSLLARKGRLVMSGLAIVLGVAFVSGTMIFTSTLQKTFDSLATGMVGDVVVDVPRELTSMEESAPAIITPQQIEAVKEVDGVKDIAGDIANAQIQLLDKDGKLLGGQGAPAIAMTFHELPSANGGNPAYVVDGRAPQADNEVAVDPNTLKRSKLQIGEDIRMLLPSKADPISFKIVGTALSGNGTTGGAQYAFLTSPELQKLFTGGKDVYQSLWVVRDDNVSQADLVKRINDAQIFDGTDLKVRTGDEVAAETSDAVAEQMQFVNIFLLAFAGIALIVGAFLIVNTFSILVAQRSRELALFRAMGASKGQISRSVLFEALIIALFGSALGVLLGFGLAWGITKLFDSMGLSMGSGLAITATPIIVGFIVGIVMTLISAWWPARKASKVAPVSAMRGEAAKGARKMHLGVILGTGMLVLGAALLLVGTFADFGGDTQASLVGMALMLFGTAIASPVLGLPVLAGLGWLYTRMFGSVGKLARDNAIRNPGRTAATASALMIGLAMVTTMSIGGQSAKSSLDQIIDKSVPAEIVLQSKSMMTGFAPEVVDRAAKVEGVQYVTPFRWSFPEINGTPDAVSELAPGDFGRYFDQKLAQGNLDDFKGPDAMMVDRAAADEKGWKLGDTVTVKNGQTSHDFKLVALYDQLQGAGPGASVTEEGYKAINGDTSVQMVFVKVADGASADQVREAIQDTVKDNPVVNVTDQSGLKESMSSQIDQMLTMIYALLALAVIIAIFGIVNTLGLSVIERTREVGLLRAIGFRRGQLGQMIRLESVAIALLGAILGVGLGVLFGWALQRIMADEGLAVFAVPVGQVVAFVVVSGIVGVLAALAPARRAARMDVLKAIATE